MYAPGKRIVDAHCHETNAEENEWNPEPGATIDDEHCSLALPVAGRQRDKEAASLFGSKNEMRPL
jgi:hypothetical protein